MYKALAVLVHLFHRTNLNIVYGNVQFINLITVLETFLTYTYGILCRRMYE